MEETLTAVASALLLRIARVSPDILARAFAGVDSYKEYLIPKNSGGYRKISEPSSDLKKVQENILIWLQRLEKRQMKVSSLKNVPELADKMHELDYRLHGSRLSRSVVTATKALTENNFLFLTKLDLKDAFPSVTKEILENLFEKVFLDECRLHYWRARRKLFVKAIPEISMAAASSGLEYPVVKERGSKKGDELQKKWLGDMAALIAQMGFSDLHIPDKKIEMLFGVFDKYISGRFSEIDSISLKDRRRIINREQLAIVGLNSKNILRQPLFLVKKNRDLHAIIWEAAKNSVAINDSVLPKIMNQLAHDLSKLVTCHNVLPQGAPTSGFLLNLTISEIGLVDNVERILNASPRQKHRKFAISVYVDDIAIVSMKRPSKTFLSNLEKAFSKSDIFRVNRKKTKVYDLRNFAAPILGMKLVRRPLNQKERTNLEKIHCNDLPRGYVRACKKNRSFSLVTVTLSQAKQKQYRAFLHRLAVSGGTDDEWKKAEGCFGHIISVYGGIENLPSSLKSAVKEFRSNFIN